MHLLSVPYLNSFNKTRLKYKNLFETTKGSLIIWFFFSLPSLEVKVEMESSGGVETSGRTRQTQVCVCGDGG